MQTRIRRNENFERQEANRILRKGMKRPENGYWPIASNKTIKGIAWHKSQRRPNDANQIFGN